jgi:uncharacterized membrane protein
LVEYIAEKQREYGGGLSEAAALRNAHRIREVMMKDGGAINGQSQVAKNVKLSTLMIIIIIIITEPTGCWRPKAAAAAAAAAA